MIPVDSPPPSFIETPGAGLNHAPEPPRPARPRLRRQKSEVIPKASGYARAGAARTVSLPWHETSDGSGFDHYTSEFLEQLESRDDVLITVPLGDGGTEQLVHQTRRGKWHTKLTP